MENSVYVGKAQGHAVTAINHLSMLEDVLAAMKRNEAARRVRMITEQLCDLNRVLSREYEERRDKPHLFTGAFRCECQRHDCPYCYKEQANAKETQEPPTSSGEAKG